MGRVGSGRDADRERREGDRHGEACGRCRIMALARHADRQVTAAIHSASPFEQSLPVRLTCRDNLLHALADRVEQLLGPNPA